MVKGVAIQAGGHGDGVRYKRGALGLGPGSKRWGRVLRYSRGARDEVRYRQSIKQSKILTEPPTGKEKPHPSTTTGGSKPCVTSDAGLGGCERVADTGKGQ